jgi:aspartate kinase
MITTSEVAVSVTIDNGSQLKQIVKELEPFGVITVEENQTIVSVVGNEIAQTKNVLSKLFEALAPVPVSMVSYGGSKHNVSILVPSSYKLQTLQLLNKGLFGLD